MKIYTRTGDKGKTSLLSGARVSKYHLRIESYGTIDELNSLVGLLLTYEFDLGQKQFLSKVQNQLFDIGALLSDESEDNMYNLKRITDEDITVFEQMIDLMESRLEPLRYFIIPGGNQAAATCHVCRTVCRRAERFVVQLSENTTIDELIVKYINRFSDYLFVLARDIMRYHQIAEVKWMP